LIGQVRGTSIYPVLWKGLFFGLLKERGKKREGGERTAGYYRKKGKMRKGVNNSSEEGVFRAGEKKKRAPVFQREKKENGRKRKGTGSLRKDRGRRQSFQSGKRGKKREPYFYRRKEGARRASCEAWKKEKKRKKKKWACTGSRRKGERQKKTGLSLLWLRGERILLRRRCEIGV